MPEDVSSVDILLEEDGLNGPTINYTLQRETVEVESFRGISQLIQIKYWHLRCCLVLQYDGLWAPFPEFWSGSCRKYS